MKKKLVVFLLSLYFLSFLILPSFAIESPPTKTDTQRFDRSVIPPEKPPINFLGQDHYYSVTFRGNGEAIINLKIILSNLQDDPLSSVSLRVPMVDPKDIAVYQVIREKQCMNYKYEQPMPINENLRQIDSQQPQEIPPTEPLPTKIAPTFCEQYQEPDYYNWYGEAKYQKAQYDLTADTITVILPQPIEINSSGSFVVYYRALGYAKKNLLGAYNFLFETLKINDKIRTLQVGITTDSDLLLRGATGKVNYRFDEGVTALKSTELSMGAIQSPQFDNFYQQIGQGGIVKTASNLQSLDSYKVKGSYADSLFKLYTKEIVVSVIITLLLLVVLILVIKKIIKNMQKKEESAKNNAISIFTALGTTFVSSLFIFGYTIFIFLVNQYFTSYYYQYSFIIFIFLILISIGIYAFLLFAPALFSGYKKGLGWGIAVFALTILWLIFYLIIIFIVFFFLYRGPPVYTETFPPTKTTSVGK
jgi:hypothetical protein